MAEDSDTASHAPETKKVRLETSTQIEVAKDNIAISRVDTDTMVANPITTDGKQETIEQSQGQMTETAHGNSTLADPSFKEMPHTFLQPNDPALLTCM